MYNKSSIYSFNKRFKNLIKFKKCRHCKNIDNCNCVSVLFITYRCFICRKRFSTIDVCIEHIKLHFHCCKICNRKFRRHISAVKHMENFHKCNNDSNINNIKPYSHKCIICNSLFTSGRKLRAHITRIHIDKSLMCCICGNLYDNRRALIKHIGLNHISRN